MKWILSILKSGYIVTKIFPNIHDGSMNNTIYHTVRLEQVPTSNMKKADMQDSLRQNNITFHKENWTQWTNKNVYTSHNQLAIKNSIHDVLQLLSYHCDLKCNIIDLGVRERVNQGQATAVGWNFMETYIIKDVLHLEIPPAIRNTLWTWL